MYNTSKNYCQRQLSKYDSTLIDFLKNDEFSKTSNIKSNLPSHSLEYKRRKQIYNIKSSILKLDQSESNENKSLYPEMKLEVNRIQNVKALNNEFTKKVYHKTKKRILNEEAQQTSFDIRFFGLNKHPLSEKQNKLNNNVHNQILSFDNSSDDITNQQLIILRRYSIYTFEMIKNALNKKNRSINSSPNTESRYFSKSLDTFFQRQAIPNNILTLNLTNSSEIKKEIKQALQSTTNAIIEAVDEKRKKLSNNVEKTYAFKEKEINPFFDNILEKVFRKVNYITEKNNPICEDYVLNLIHDEIVNITQNIENLIKSPAFIKNFSKKNDIEMIGNNKILPFLNQNSSNKTGSNNLNKTFFNSSNKLSNQLDLNAKLSKKYSVNSNKLTTNLLSIKEENLNEDNLQDYSDLQNRNQSSKGKRNLSKGGDGLVKKNSQIKLPSTLKDNEVSGNNNEQESNLHSKGITLNKFTSLSNIKIKDIKSLNIEESYNTNKSNEEILKLNDLNLQSKNESKLNEIVNNQ